MFNYELSKTQQFQRSLSHVRVSLNLLFFESFHETRGIWLIKISDGQEGQRWYARSAMGTRIRPLFSMVWGWRASVAVAVANFPGIEPHCALNRSSRLQKTCPLCNCIGDLHVACISLQRNTPWRLSPFSHFISPFSFLLLENLFAIEDRLKLNWRFA